MKFYLLIIAAVYLDVNYNLAVIFLKNGEKFTFEYLNGMLLYETRGEKYFHYYYDSNGTLCAVSYRLTPSDDENIYYYTHNWRGDIVGIYTDAGDLTAKYTYDSWGNVTSITDGNGNAITSSTHIGNLNPFRYRGYYMDTETGMYYLMSRYYDPVTHRFVNADGYFQTGLGILDSNMNAYCGNNPINCVDFNGDCSVHLGWYQPNCFECNPDYLRYIQNNLDWYNRVTGSNAIGLDDNGKFIYQHQVNAANELSNLSDRLSFTRGLTYGVAGFYLDSSPNISAGITGWSYLATTPISIVSHLKNPYLLDWQKTVLVSSEIFTAVGMVALTWSIGNFWHPGGWVGTAVSIGLFLLPYVISSSISCLSDCWENENKYNWSVKK